MNGLKLILAVVLVAINAFFVAAEYALVRSRRARLEVMREEGLRGSALALSQLDRINEYISAVQIGVTMTSIGIGALATPRSRTFSRERSAARQATTGNRHLCDRRVRADRGHAADRRRDGAQALRGGPL